MMNARVMNALKYVKENAKQGNTLSTHIIDEIDTLININTKGKRVYHPIFGAGTTITVLGPVKICINFDDYGLREVYIDKLISIDVLLDKETRNK